MNAYAIMETGGKQYRVSPGDAVEVEHLDADVGAEVTLNTVLAIGEGEALRIGAPYVDSAKVVCSVEAQARGPKVFNFKKKRRKGYRRKIGHRQDVTVLRVKSVE